MNDEAPKDKPQRDIEANLLLLHKRYLNLLVKPVFDVGQFVELHGIAFQVVEVTATRVVLALDNDPQVQAWFKELH